MIPERVAFVGLACRWEGGSLGGTMDNVVVSVSWSPDLSVWGGTFLIGTDAGAMWCASGGAIGCAGGGECGAA
jgi:hypothetical protein